MLQTVASFLFLNKNCYMTSFHSLKIKHIERITPNSVVVTFAVPGSHMADFRFDAGQYLTIKKELNGQELRRAYSICTDPGEGVLKVGIKKTPDGTFSHYANTELKVGDVWEVHPPEGRFTFKPDASKSRNIAAFAAGSGITPIMSIMKTVLRDEPQSKFVLLYGNKSLTETMFYDEIIELTKQYPERLKVHFIYSRSQEPQALFGRIERSTVNFILKNRHKEQVFEAFYLCGPEQMITTVSDTLKEHGIDENAIKFELFSTPVEEGAPEKLPEGKTQITIMLDDEETSFTMDTSKLVLDAVLEKGIDAPYSCQGGICSSCIARITEGKAEMVKNQILTDSEIAEGLILTCQAHVLTDRIGIDYDDV